MCTQGGVGKTVEAHKSGEAHRERARESEKYYRVWPHCLGATHTLFCYTALLAADPSLR